MSARMLAWPAAEVPRLRAELGELRGLTAALVAALPDPRAEMKYRRQLCPGSCGHRT